MEIFKKGEGKLDILLLNVLTLLFVNPYTVTDKMKLIQYDYDSLYNMLMQLINSVENAKQLCCEFLGNDCDKIKYLDNTLCVES